MMVFPHSHSRRILAAFVVLALTPAFAFAQALPGLSSLRVTYNTRKATVKPQGELKTQIDAIDKEIADAFRTGNAGEVRRLLAKGMTLLRGEAWTPALDYQNSLVLRSERTIVDSSVPYAVRLEQIYRPSIELTPALSARATLRPRQDPPRPGAVAATVEAPAIPLGTFEGVSRDLRESPFPMELDLSAVPDGPYILETTVVDGTTPVTLVRLGISLHKGLDAKLAALAVGAAALPEAVRPDVTYPGDYIRNINRGRVRIGTFDVARELKTAESVLAVAKTGKDPFAGRTGDLERHYALAGAGEVMPYRVYVPRSYSGSTPLPLVIALHGLGATEDSFFDAYDGQAPRLAEQHGFLLAAPLGYRVDGFYGSAIGGNPSDAASRRRLALSEQDVLEVVRLMRAHYKVDDTRVYLIGHSMGAIGTWHLAAKYPDVWAALGLFAGLGNPATAGVMKAIPQVVVHGDADPTVSVEGSRTMVAKLKEAGATVTYIEVPGGGHTDVVVPNLPKVFEFLAAQKKT